MTKLSRVVLTYTLGTGAEASVRTITYTHTNYETVTLYTTVFVDPTSADAAPAAWTTSTGAALAESSSTSALAEATALTSSSVSTTSSSTIPTLASSTTTTTTTTPSSSIALEQSTTGPSSTPVNVQSSSVLTSSLSTSSAVSSTLAATSSCASIAPPAATQAGVISGCTEWYVAVPGDYCYSVADKYGIDVYTFMAWNPAVVYPSCSNMLAGDAYCVATCSGTAAATVSPSAANTIVSTLSGTTLTYTTVPSTFTPASASPTGTSGANVYRSYTGDGSVAAGWPSESSWIDFEAMFNNNVPQMQASCAQWGVTDDSDQEISDMAYAIQSVGSESGVDPRVILAVVMQESTGCVRVITTAYSVQNPGLMQSHAGNGTCNGNSAPLNVPGTTGSTSTVQVPCPQSEITQMIRDGTEGTSSGDGLEQLYAAQTAAGFSGAQAWYRTVRAYNGGSVAVNGVLEDGCCTSSYASDIANRLTGWTTAARAFNG